MEKEMPVEVSEAFLAWLKKTWEPKNPGHFTNQAGAYTAVARMAMQEAFAAGYALGAAFQAWADEKAAGL